MMMSESIASPRQQQPQKLTRKKYLTETEDQFTDDNDSPPNLVKRIKGMTLHLTRGKKVFSLKLL